MSRLLFYDLETSGLDKSFDQILQFAAVETDQDLNLVNNYEWWVRLNADIWPSPCALAVTGISLQQLERYGRPEYEVVSQIHALFNRPGTISLGYNTLGFDDEFLRFSFHRNLLEPYTHQYADDCYRMDVYPMLLMRFLIKPEGIVWPEGISKDGRSRISMKLEDIRVANDLPVDGRSHNAMSDVMCTIEVARMLRRDLVVWQWMAKHFVKSGDARYTADACCILNGLTVTMWAAGEFGSDQHFLTVACYLGRHRHYSNQELWLRLDVRYLGQLNGQVDKAFGLIVRKKLGEPPFALSYAGIYGFLIGDERRELVERNLSFLGGGLLDWQEYWLEYKYPIIPNLDIDAGLYQQGFLSPAVRKQCVQLHVDLASLIHSEDFSSLLTNLPVEQHEQLVRILGRNYPRLLASYSASEWGVWNDYLVRAIWGGMLNHQARKRRNAVSFCDEWLKCQALTDDQRHELSVLYDRRKRTYDVGS